MTTAIDIGTGASDLNASTSYTGGYTYLDYNNPANATGILTKFEVWADSNNMSNVRFGTFTYSSGTTFAPRAWTASLGTATAGQKTTFTPGGFGLSVSSGDYLAIYWETNGALSYNNAYGGGLYRVSGRPTSSTSFTLAGAAYKAAIYATGSTRPAQATNFTATGYSDKVTLAWTKSADAQGYLWYVDGGDIYTAGDVATVDDTVSVPGTWSLLNAATTATKGTYTDKVALGTQMVEINMIEHMYNLQACIALDDALIGSGSWISASDFMVQPTIYYQFKRDIGAGYENVGSKTSTSTYDDTGAPAPVITPGTSAASDGTFNFKVTCSNSGESIANGATATYKCTVSAAYLADTDIATDTGYRKKGDLSYQWQISAADSDADYSDIAGATSSTLTFYDAPSGVGRYYRCKLTASGSTTQYSTAERGYRVLLTPTVII